MRKLVLAGLAAATGLMPVMAEARGPIVRDGPHPVPNVRIHAPGHQAGTSWQAPMHRRDMPGMRRDHGRGINHYSNYRMIRRGGFVPIYWASPRYGISNYGMYGFGQPIGGARWVRYYDDALMVDRTGRVIDGRYGMDFDRYGDRWDDDDRGIPMYDGYGDDYPEDRDYAWSDRFEHGGRDYDRDYPYDYPYGGEGRGYGAYGHGGYVSGGYTMIETITTTTGPSTVHYTAAPKKRFVKVKRRYSAGRPYRAKTAARCVCR